MKSDLIRPPFASVNRDTVNYDLLVALAPIIAWSCIVFGIRTLIPILFSAIICAALDVGANLILYKRVGKEFFASAITGVLIALSVSADVPLLSLAIGCFAAIFAAKYQFIIFGKKGNILCPSALGILVCSLLPGASSHFLDCFRDGAMPEGKLLNIFIGNTQGAVGCVSAMLLLVGALYLMLRGAVSFRIFLSASVVLSALCLLFYSEWTTHTENMIYQLICGGFFFFLTFVACDRSGTPFSGVGKIIYGAGFGALVFALRCYTSLPAPEAISVLVMNVASPFIDLLTRPVPFGGRRKA